MDQELTSQPSSRRRRRPALACISCRKRKLRCDRSTPCNNCIRSKKAICAYEPLPPEKIVARPHKDRTEAILSDPNVNESPIQPAPPPEATKSDRFRSLGTPNPAGGSASLWTAAPTPDSLTSHSNSALLADTDRSGATGPGNSPGTSQESLKEPTAVLAPITSVQSYLGKREWIHRAVVAKTRYFGPSHWMNSAVLFPKIFRIMEKYAYDPHCQVHDLLVKAKSLGRLIKRNRTIAFPTQFGLKLPPKDIADKLIDAYLRTFERVYRILHVPTFRTEYERFWSSPERSDETFIIKLQLCLAIGACFYDASFSFRVSAINWVHEAQLWLATPSPEKTRMTIVGLQIMCLLHLARETAGVNGDLVWVSAGALLRTAMYMGLHRDPSHLPPMSLFQAELRRRLWGTILELTLQSSIESGGPPLFTMDDFDTEPPDNLDDEQLVESDNVTPVPKPQQTYTDASFLIALRKILPLRLEIAKFINNFRAPQAYEETLRLSTELAAACRTVTQSVNSFKKSDSRPSSFHVKLMELLTRRFLIVLHSPFMERALENPAYYFSRKTVIDTSLKLYLSCCPAAVLVTGLPQDVTPNEDEDDYARLSLCAAGPFRSIVTQAHMLITVEVMTQLEEDEGMGAATPRVDLLHSLRCMLVWTRQRIYAGETNIKGHLFVTAMQATIDALLQDLNGEELEKLVVARGLEALQECIGILREFAGESPPSSTVSQAGAGADDMPMLDEGWPWDDVGQDNEFDIGNTESFLGAGWMFNQKLGRPF